MWYYVKTLRLKTIRRQNITDKKKTLMKQRSLQMAQEKTIVQENVNAARY